MKHWEFPVLMALAGCTARNHAAQAEMVTFNRSLMKPLGIQMAARDRVKAILRASRHDHAFLQHSLEHAVLPLSRDLTAALKVLPEPRSKEVSYLKRSYLSAARRQQEAVDELLRAARTHDESRVTRAEKMVTAADEAMTSFNQDKTFLAARLGVTRQVQAMTFPLETTPPIETRPHRAKPDERKQ